MKKSLLLSLVGVVVAAVIVVTSCNPTQPTTPGTTIPGTTTPGGQTTVPPSTVPPSTTPATESTEPEYGGTLPFIVGQTGGFDPANVLNFWPSWCLMYDPLVAEDWTKGPSGTGEIPLSSNYTPVKYFTGWLAESWEIVDTKTIIYHLRQGVKFWNKAPVNGRELTADDVVANFNRFAANPNSSWYKTTDTVTKVDKYTVKWTEVNPNPELPRLGSYNFVIGAPEIAQLYGDMTDWKKDVGTGPFIPIDVVPESSITYQRNPDYFAMDPLHPNNQLPYVEQLRALVILDPATQDSAMRTGKVMSEGLTLDRAKQMLKTNPELQSRKVYPGNTYVPALHQDQKTSPLSDVRVRQALTMAIDRPSIINGLYQGDATLLQWPVQPTIVEAYTPYEELPANLKKLYEYHPDEAQALLAEAGYGKGFTLTIEMLQGTYAGGTDLYSIVKNNWDAIGVNTTLLIDDATAFWSRLIGKTYKDTSPCAWGNGAPTGGLLANYTGYGYNYSLVSDPKIDAALDDINLTFDDAERMAKIKDISLYIIGQVYWINMPTPYGYALWQPWVKGYHGEVAWGPLNGWYGMLRFTWIDSALRAKLGE